MKPLLLPIAALMLAAAIPTPAAPTNAAPTNATPVNATPVNATPVNAAPRLDFESFRIISDRNIFNASRSGQVRGTRNSQRTVQVDFFKLLGTLSYEKGRFALFDGSSPTYKKSASPNEVVAGFKIADIGPNSIKLITTNSQVLEMKVGMAMRRQDNGPWALTGQALSAATSSTSAAKTDSSEASAGGAMSDVLQRLMKKREQELNK